MSVDLGKLMVDSKRIATEHGFETGWHNFSEKLMLIVSELSEALEEFRADKDEIYFRESDGKPEGIPVELADAVIRIAELAQSLNLPLEHAIQIKQAFNETRPFKHGKRI